MTLFIIFHFAEPWQNSLTSSPPTAWSPSTSPRRNGTSSPELSPRPPASPWPRPSLAPSHSTTRFAWNYFLQILFVTRIDVLKASESNIKLDEEQVTIWLLKQTLRKALGQRLCDSWWCNRFNHLRFAVRIQSSIFLFTVNCIEKTELIEKETGNDGLIK